MKPKNITLILILLITTSCTQYKLKYSDINPAASNSRLSLEVTVLYNQEYKGVVNIHQYQTPAGRLELITPEGKWTPSSVILRRTLDLYTAGIPKDRR